MSGSESNLGSRAVQAAQDKFPPACDVFIACHEDDLPQCEKLKHILELLFVDDPNGRRNLIVGPLESDFGQSRLCFYEKQNNLTIFVFMYISENFEKFMQLVKEQAIEKEIKDNKNQIIPVYRCGPGEREFQVYGLDGRKGINAADCFESMPLEDINIERVNYENLNESMVKRLEKSINKELNSEEHKNKVKRRKENMEQWIRDYVAKYQADYDTFRQELDAIGRINEESTARLARELSLCSISSDSSSDF